jgi:hypothetical protein
MEFLDKVISFVGSIEGMTATVAVILEFVLRLFKSEKPLGILHFAAALVGKFAVLLTKIAQLSDKVLPQKIEAPKV